MFNLDNTDLSVQDLIDDGIDFNSEGFTAVTELFDFVDLTEEH